MQPGITCWPKISVLVHRLGLICHVDAGREDDAELPAKRRWLSIIRVVMPLILSESVWNSILGASGYCQ